MDKIVAVLVQEMDLDMVQDGVWREVAEAIGISELMKVLEIIGGATIYAPKTDTLLRPIRDIKIKQEFSGYNHMDLARKYNLSERHIRDLCGDGIVPGQISIFDRT